MLVRAYDDLGDAVEAGDGCPIPGYAAPDDTVASATRVAQVLLGVTTGAQVAGLDPAPTRDLTAAERASVEPVRSLGSPGGTDTQPLSDAWVVRGLMAWSTLLGHVSLQLFGHMYRGVLDYDAHFAQVVEQLADDLGLPAH